MNPKQKTYTTRVVHHLFFVTEKTKLGKLISLPTILTLVSEKGLSCPSPDLAQTATTNLLNLLHPKSLLKCEKTKFIKHICIIETMY
jgi:hypothetical protein